MFYNKDNPQWIFNEEQYLSSEEYSRIVEDNLELVKNVLSSDVRDWNTTLYGIKEKGTPEEIESRKKKSIIGIVLGIIIFASLVLSLVLKQLVIFGFIACAILLYVGISMIVTGKGEAVESASKAGLNRIIGIVMSLASVALCLLIIFRAHFSEAEFFIILFSMVFGFAGTGLLVAAVLKALSGKLVYTQEVNATCKGYVRYVTRDSGENNRVHTFICTSPLFDYSVDGIQYEAVWDEFVAKKDSDIALGQTVPIKVDPKHPESILSPVTTHAGAIAFMIVLALLCIGAAVGMGIYTASGAARDMTVETEWNPVINQINGETEPTLMQVTDDMIQQAYAGKLNGSTDWYFETAVVAKKDTTADGVEISFTDPAINFILFKDGNAPEPGTEMLLFYTVDEEYLNDYGIRYKRVFSSGVSGEFEYVGSHGAFVAE